ncbi:universal stress protein [Amycolatopsis acidicola]|uniref:Universal stress protein n=1 Tax=Amycolatopsis acidicola TaxID=2596893 RepID=A0A5N0V0U6_9PSEU|nr:universal stress protein [Amycolatopsis acidicola]KAA9157458.1 universal stress protein [Amycolatopsis acidicola]
MSAPIVVGMDGSGAAERAVRWSAAEAVRRGMPLHLVHCASAPGERLEAPVAVDERVEVCIESTVDKPVRALLRRSAGAVMVVLGAAGATATGLIAHARCPVAVTRGRELPGVGEGPVVVGVDGSAGSEPALALAFEEAALRQSPLVALHATVGEPRGGSAAEALAEWERKFPDVAVRLVIEHDHPRRQSVRWSEHACLFVAGARGRGGFPGLPLGSTAQTLLHHAGCPLLIVPVSAT